MDRASPLFLVEVWQENDGLWNDDDARQYECVITFSSSVEQDFDDEDTTQSELELAVCVISFSLMA